MRNKKMYVVIFLDKKLASICKFLAEKLRLNFLIVKSPNWQDSYTTYSKISAIHDKSPKK